MRTKRFAHNGSANMQSPSDRDVGCLHSSHLAYAPDDVRRIAHGSVKSILTIRPKAGVVLTAAMSTRISCPVAIVAFAVLITAGVAAVAVEFSPESIVMLVESI